MSFTYEDSVHASPAKRRHETNTSPTQRTDEDSGHRSGPKTSSFDGSYGDIVDEVEHSSSRSPQMFNTRMMSIRRKDDVDNDRDNQSSVQIAEVQI